MAQWLRRVLFLAEYRNKGSVFNCWFLFCFTLNKCYFQGNWLQQLAKYIRFSMFEEVQLLDARENF